MNMKRLALVALVSVFTIGSNAYADALKIGVVNMDQVIQKSPLAMSYNDKIIKQFKPRQDEINTAQKKLQDDLDQLNYGGYKLSQDDRTKLQNTVTTDRRNAELLAAAFQRDLASTQSQYTQALMAKLGTVIGKIAQDSKYDLIQTSANILYLNTAIDITPQVIQQLQ